MTAPMLREFLTWLGIATVEPEENAVVRQELEDATKQVHEVQKDVRRKAVQSSRQAREVMGTVEDVFQRTLKVERKHGNPGEKGPNL